MLRADVELAILRAMEFDAFGAEVVSVPGEVVNALNLEIISSTRS